MYQSATKLEKLKYFTGLTESFCSEFYWWHTFIANWNGLYSSCANPTMLIMSIFVFSLMHQVLGVVVPSGKDAGSNGNGH